MSDSLSLNCLDNTPGWLVKELADFFKDQHQAEARVVGARQELHAKKSAQGRRSIDGLGQCVAVVDSYSHAYWNQREPGCWSDDKFIKEFLRDNPAARVQSKGTKEIHVGYAGVAGAAKSKSFHKSYG
jgi:hypothetical protein